MPGTCREENNMFFEKLRWSVVAAAVISVSVSAVYAAPWGAVITSFQNDVTVSTGPAAAFMPAKKGMKCLVRSTVKTGPGATAELCFEDGTALKVEQNSRIIIQAARRTQTVSEYLIDLVKGRLLNNVIKSRGRNKSKFAVRTPTAVASVRGTVFVVDAADEASVVAVYDGTVEAGQPGVADAAEPAGGVAIPANSQSAVAKGAAAAAPVPLEQEFADYRKNVAELFNQRIAYFREHMEEVRKMNEEYMENWRKEMQSGMDQNKKENDDAMKQFREQFNVKPAEEPPADMR